MYQGCVKEMTNWWYHKCTWVRLLNYELTKMYVITAHDLTGCATSNLQGCTCPRWLGNLQFIFDVQENVHVQVILNLHAYVQVNLNVYIHLQIY